MYFSKKNKEKKEREMKIARWIFCIAGMLIYLWGMFWPQQETEMYLLNNMAIVVGLTIVVCGLLIFRDPETRPWDQNQCSEEERK